MGRSSAGKTELMMDFREMVMKCSRYGAFVVISSMIATVAVGGDAKYGTGVSDKEIKIGNVAPYSGPASAYSAGAKTQAAYFRMINRQGGVKGRQLTFLSYDDAFSPPKTVEQTRRLIEQDDVFILFGSVGTATNSAVHKYLNGKKVPQAFVASGATKWNDPAQYPWTMGWQPDYQSEGRVYAKYLLREQAGKKVGVLFQNDDYGKDILKGLKQGLGNSSGVIVSEQSYDISEPTIDGHVVRMKAANPEVIISITTPKFGAQSIKKIAELGWKPIHIVSFISSSIGAAIRPAGLENAQGILTSTFMKDATDPRWKDDKAVKDFTAFMNEYYPDGDKTDASVFYSYGVAQALIYVLELCGNDLTRENFMRQAESIRDLEVDVLLPGIRVNTSARRHQPIDQLQMQRFAGDRWELFGEIYDGDVGR